MLINLGRAAVVLFILIVTSQAGAQTVVFGPETFRASLQGTAINRSFTSPSNAEGVLTVVNGNGQNLSPVTCTGNLIQRLLCEAGNLLRAVEVALVRPQTLELILNGAQVLAPSAYRPELGQIQISIRTRTGTPVNAVSNQLVIRPRGSPLGTVRIQIAVQPTAPNQLPIARFTFTPNNALAPAVVSFSGLTSSDPDGSIASYSWNFDDGGTATGVMVTHLFQTGRAYNVRLTVTDNRGGTNSLTQVVTLVTDATPPSLVSLTRRFIVTSLPATVPMTMQASEALSSATVNGVSLVVQGAEASGSVSFSQSGLGSYPVVLRDIVGNQSNLSEQIEIVLDQNAPVIGVNLPAVLAINQTSIAVPVVVTDETQVMTTVTVNGVQVLTTANPSFSYLLNLPVDGDYQVVATGVDEAGRSAIPQTRLIRRDSQPPILSSIEPAAGARLNSRLVTVTGQVNETANVTVNGTAATVTGGQFAASVRAQREGTYAIQILATDAAGNLVNQSFEVLIDTGSDRLWTYEECPVNGSL